MKRFLFYLISSMMCASAIMADNPDIGITKEQAKSVVKNFYDALSILPGLDNNDFFRHRDENIYPLLISIEMHLPSDFRSIVRPYDKYPHGVSIQNYVGDVFMYGKENDLSLNFDIDDGVQLTMYYDYEDYAGEKKFWEFRVEKSYTINGNKYSFTDSVLIASKSGKIVKILNAASLPPDPPKPPHKS